MKLKMSLNVVKRQSSFLFQQTGATFRRVDPEDFCRACRQRAAAENGISNNIFDAVLDITKTKINTDQAK